MEWKINSESFPKEKFDSNSVAKPNAGVRRHPMEQRQKIDGAEPFKGF
jgi:hypothetical protein